MTCNTAYWIIVAAGMVTAFVVDNLLVFTVLAVAVSVIELLSVKLEAFIRDRYE